MSSLCECQLHLANTRSADCQINAFNCQTARLICTKCTFAITHIHLYIFIQIYTHLYIYIYVYYTYIFTFIYLYVRFIQICIRRLQKSSCIFLFRRNRTRLATKREFDLAFRVFCFCISAKCVR